MVETQESKKLGWSESFAAVLHPRVITMLFFGFSAGIPILLIFSSLSLWLREAGVERQAVTFFSWAALGYSFKFIWAPLVDVLPLPILTNRLGRRRSWLLLSQFAIIGSLLLMASIDPAENVSRLELMALAAVLLGFSSATQDILIDAYRIESAESRLQAMMSASYVAGYRIGMVTSGAGALYLASFLGSEMGSYFYGAWQWTYVAMAGAALVGVFTTLVISEPVVEKKAARYHYQPKDYFRLILVFLVVVATFVSSFFYGSRLLPIDASSLSRSPFLAFAIEVFRFAFATATSLLVGYGLVKLSLVDRKMARETWVEPVLNFFTRYGLRTALTILSLVGLYRISDIVLGVISNVFYQDMGFSKVEIANAVKTFGVLITIAGGYLGGIFATRFGVMKALLWGALMSSATNILFIALAYTGRSLPLMYTVVGADNLAAGFASAAFIAFLSSLTSVSFTAVQYAIFSSLMTLLPKVIGGYSGTIVEGIGYTGFFIFSTLIGIPVIPLCLKAAKLLLASKSKNE